jgi:hypothetical protein
MGQETHPRPDAPCCWFLLRWHQLLDQFVEVFVNIIAFVVEVVEEVLEASHFVQSPRTWGGWWNSQGVARCPNEQSEHIGTGSAAPRMSIIRCSLWVTQSQGTTPP